MNKLIGGLLLGTALYTSIQLVDAAPKVLSDIAPTHSLVSMVMGDIGKSSLLIRSTNSPHDFSLRPSDASKLSNADIIFYTGSMLTPWLNDVMTSLANGTPNIELITTNGTTLLEFRHNNVFEHNHSHASAEHSSSTTYDPHAWLDPSNAQLWLKRIAHELASIDPDNATTYTTNATQAINHIDKVSNRVRQSLININDSPYVVFHDSYHYFESYFDIHASATINLADSTLPSISQISQLQNLLKENNAACVFSEPQYSDRIVNTITEGTNVKRGVLDPLGANLPSDANLYPALIQSLANKLIQCLSTER